MSMRQAESPLPEEMTSKKPKVDVTSETEVTVASPVETTPTTASTEAQAPEPAAEDVTNAAQDHPETPAPKKKGINKATEGAAPTTTPTEAQTSEPAAVDLTNAAQDHPDTPAPKRKTRISPKKPPVADGLEDFKPELETPPPANPFWGIRPLPGSTRPDPVQPPARSSGGQTNPPLWENRGYRFKRGSRHVKYFGPLKPDNEAELKPTLDQQDLCLIKLVDMRPKSKNDPTPRRVPVIYNYGKVPKDWDHGQSVKALNDRRYAAIERTTMDAPWTRIECEYLASLLEETPDASIWELTERHNERFMGRDYTTETGMAFGNLSIGRTVESVRNEYMTYKPRYDKGMAPKKVRHRTDQSMEGKALRASKRFEEAFGKPDKALQAQQDQESGSSEEDSDSEDDAGNGEDDDTPKPKKRTPKKKESETTAETEKGATPSKGKGKGKRPAEEDPEDEPRPSKVVMTSAVEDDTPVTPYAGQPALNDDEEELLKLGVPGYRRSGAAPQSSTQGMVPASPISYGFSSPQSNSVSSIDRDLPVAGSEPVSSTVEQVEIEETIVEVTSVEETVVEDTPVVKRRTSLHAVRKIDIEEDYSDDDDEDLAV
ncbi:hypothetical protein BDW02DRAFT_39278 [Decorospora gaudefroyi]|uniref:Uncharacterized protein n=1 Tax=Decorospora gaudefroyi TaxID=184978 RepID=A0A6A5K6S1_9PLEO|nr:hypothetical protein BDW02DRAFT_39278 [Decorospora gaudefroyi]